LFGAVPKFAGTDLFAFFQFGRVWFTDHLFNAMQWGKWQTGQPLLSAESDS